MLFDPDDGLTMEQSFQRQWNQGFEPAIKAELVQLAEAHGCTPFEIALHLLKQFRDDWNDPIERQRIEAWRDHR